MFAYKLKSVLLVFSLMILGTATQNCSDETSSRKNKKNLPEPISGLYLEIWAPGAIDTYGTYYSDDDLDGTFEIVDSNPLPYELPTGITYDVRFYGWFDDNDADLFTEEDSHLLCFDVTNNVVSIAYADEDSNGLNVGLRTDWTPTAAPGTTGEVTFTLYHEPGTKTGTCPDVAVVDLEVSLPIKIIN